MINQVKRCPWARSATEQAHALGAPRLAVALHVFLVLGQQLVGQLLALNTDSDLDGSLGRLMR